MQGETMVSETVLGVLFCFFLPLAVAARFWHWYTFFKRNQKVKLIKEMQKEQDNEQRVLINLDPK